MWAWLFLLALVLLIILKVWPKGLFVIIGIVAAFSVAVFFWQRHLETEKSRIAIDVTYDVAECPTDRPMRVTITNNGEKTLERILFTLHASIPGYSSTVTPYTYKQNRSDKILKHGESYASCYAEPVMARKPLPDFDPKDLEWSAVIDSVYLQ